MDTVTIVLLVACALLLSAIVVGASFYLRRTIIARKYNFFSVNDLIRRQELLGARESQLEDMERRLRQERSNLEQASADEQKNIAVEKRRIASQQDAQRLALERVASLTVQEAKDQLWAQVRTSYARERDQLVSDEVNATKLEIDERVAEILLPAMERMAETVAKEHNTALIPLKEEMKGKIIGKDGRNRTSFERVTGTTLIVDKSDSLTISTFNPLRREIAKRTMEAMLESKAIQPVKIEAQYETVKKSFDQALVKYGKEAVAELKLYDVNPDLLPLIGSLRFRTSYGQDILTHSLECAYLAERIAAEIGADPIKAKKAAFLHDIGKARDFEHSKDHVEEGIKIAREFHLDELTTESIALHHTSNITMSKYLYITKIADTISASRPGARLESSERYFERMLEIEAIGKKFKGVTEAYALQGGREVRVLLTPDNTTDQTADELALAFKQELMRKLTLNGKVTITVIREYRKVETVN